MRFNQNNRLAATIVPHFNVVLIKGVMKHKLIVFDIDATLFDSIPFHEGKKVKIKRDHQLQHGKIKYYAYRRPYLEKFIKFCAKHFEYIGLWTHGDALWLKKFIQNILPRGTKLLFTYSYSDSEYLGRRKIKPLKKVYTNFGHLGINEHNTIMIEDTIENCVDNPKNCIIVPEFLVQENPGDITLPLLAAYIQSLTPRKSVQQQLHSRWREKIVKDLFSYRDINLHRFL